MVGNCRHSVGRFVACANLSPLLAAETTSDTIRARIERKKMKVKEKWKIGKPLSN